MLTRYNPYASMFPPRVDMTTVERQQRGNHRDLMRELERLGKDKVAVQVDAEAIRLQVERAYDNLDPSVAKYEREAADWDKRYYRVRSWQDAKKWKEKKRRQEQRRLKRQAEQQARLDALSGLGKWLVEKGWRDPPDKENEWRWFNDYHADQMDDIELGISIHSIRMFDWKRMTAASRPKVPNGLEDIAAIRELREAIRLAPDAVLTVSVEMLKKVAVHAGGAIENG